MSLQSHSTAVADLSVQHVALREILGAYELIVGLDVRTTGGHEQGGVRVHALDITVSGHGGRQVRLGTAGATHPHTVKLHDFGHSATLSFSLPLAASTLGALEELRGRGDVDFEMLVHAEIHDGMVEQVAQDTIKHTESRSDWLDKLSRSGFRDVLLIEVPLPARNPEDELGGSLRDHLLEAERHFAMSEYSACVEACRLTVEALGNHLNGSSDWAEKALNAVKAGPRDMTKDQREMALAALLRHYSHMAHHTGSEGGAENFTRAEAEWALRTTAALASKWLSGSSP